MFKLGGGDCLLPLACGCTPSAVLVSLRSVPLVHLRGSAVTLPHPVRATSLILTAPQLCSGAGRSVVSGCGQGNMVKPRVITFTPAPRLWVCSYASKRTIQPTEDMIKHFSVIYIVM